MMKKASLRQKSQSNQKGSAQQPVRKKPRTMEANIETNEPSVNLRVTAFASQGGRNYMEDKFIVAYQPAAEDGKPILYTYFGMFDGHGGKEAAEFAQAHLMDAIVSETGFWSTDDRLVSNAIKTGFIKTHQAMWKDLKNWPRTSAGHPSTSGTTATVVFIRRGKMYIGHAGDSGLAVGYQDPAQPDQPVAFWCGRLLTKDHKPECPVENQRITESGGKVIIKSGIARVVWNRTPLGHQGPIRRSTKVDEVPFLAISRSLGDLWSYNSVQDRFVVSPEPDVTILQIDPAIHRCFILATDGLWNVLTVQEAVNSIYYAEKSNEEHKLLSTTSMPPPPSSSTNTTHFKDWSGGWLNPSKRLVDRALDRWRQIPQRADNTTVITIIVDP